MEFAFFLSSKKGKGVAVLSTIRMNFATGWLLPVGRMMEWQGCTRSGRPIFTRCSCCLWWWWKSRWTRNRIGWGRGYAQWWWGWWERWWWSCWWWWLWSGYMQSLGLNWFSQCTSKLTALSFLAQLFVSYHQPSVVIHYFLPIWYTVWHIRGHGRWWWL